MKRQLLLISTRRDEASVNIAKSLLDHKIWETIPGLNSPPVEQLIPTVIYESGVSAGNDNDVILASSTRRGDLVYLWLQDSPLLCLNEADRLFSQKLISYSPILAENPPMIDEIIFLSKHSAKSGVRSLTVHPIGIPHTKNIDIAGGWAGRCVPPSRRIFALYRKLLAETKMVGLDEKYQITLEATHHGPFANVPTCFVEIGSTENDWGEEDAGWIWAKILIDHLEIILPAESPSAAVAEMDILNEMRFSRPN